MRACDGLYCARSFTLYKYIFYRNHKYCNNMYAVCVHTMISTQQNIDGHIIFCFENQFFINITTKY